MKVKFVNVAKITTKKIKKQLSTIIVMQLNYRRTVKDHLGVGQKKWIQTYSVTINRFTWTQPKLKQISEVSELLYKPKLKLCQDPCACIMCRTFFEHVDNLNFPKDEYVCEVDADISGCYTSKKLKTLESYNDDNLMWIDPPQTKMEWGGFRVAL